MEPLARDTTSKPHSQAGHHPANQRTRRKRGDQPSGEEADKHGQGGGVQNDLLDHLRPPPREQATIESKMPDLAAKALGSGRETIMTRGYACERVLQCMLERNVSHLYITTHHTNLDGEANDGCIAVTYLELSLSLSPAQVLFIGQRFD